MRLSYPEVDLAETSVLFALFAPAVGLYDCRVFNLIFQKLVCVVRNLQKYLTITIS